MGDARDYKSIARNWSLGYPHVLDPGEERPNGSNRAPLYPLLLSLATRSQDETWFGGRLLGCIAGAALAAACVFLANRAAGKGSEMIAGLLCCLYPFLILYSLLILTETLFSLFLTASLFFWCAARGSGGARTTAFLGLSLALSALTRPVVLLLPLVVCADLYLSRKKGRQVLLLCVTFVSSLLPYLAWQRVQYGSWIPITTEGGRSFYQGNNPMNQSGGAIRGVDYDYPEWTEQMSEPASSRALMAEGLRYVLDRPFLFLQRGIRKIGRLWAVFPSQASGFDTPWMALANASIVLPIYGLALAGMVSTRKEWRRQLPLYAVILYTTLFCAVFTGSQRFRLPLMPCLSVWAAVPLKSLIAAACKRTPRTP